MQAAIHIGFEISRLNETFVHLVFRHVVVADSHRQCSDAATFLAHFCEQVVRHVPQRGLDVFLVRHVRRESFLLAERLLRFAHGNKRTFINPVGELPDAHGLVAEQQFQHFQWRSGNVANPRETGRVEPRTRLRPDPWQPFIRQRMEKTCFTARRYFIERGGLGQLRRNGADELVRADAFTDGDFELLADGLANGQRDFDGRFPNAGQIEVAFINGSLLHIRREVVAVAEHPVGELLVTLEVAGQNDELRTKLSRPRGGHRREHAKLARFIRSGGDDAALLAANGHGLAAKMRVRRLLDGGKEGVGIEMNYGAGWCHNSTRPAVVAAGLVQCHRRQTRKVVEEFLVVPAWEFGIRSTVQRRS